MTIEEIFLREIFLLEIEIRLFWTVALCYGICFIAGLAYLASSKESAGKLLTLGLKTTVMIHLVLVIFRAYEVQRLPLQTIYEAVSLYILLTVITYLFIQNKYSWIHMPGVIVSGIAFIVSLYGLLQRNPIAFSSFLKFQSKWFELHTFSAFSAYALFTVGFSIEACYMAAAKLSSKNKQYKIVIPLDKRFYNIRNKLILLGFSILSISIYLGMLWGHEIWGNFWVWDPKLIWTLIMWITYAIYLHANTIGRWKEKPASFLNCLGFGAMFMAFFGSEWIYILLGTIRKCHLSL